MPCLHKLLQMIFQHTTSLGSVALLLVVRAIQALIPSSWVSNHLPQLSKIRLILNALKDPVDGFFEGDISTLRPRCHIHIWHLWFPSGSLLKSFKSRISVVMEGSWSFTLTL